MSDKSHMQTVHLSPYVSARGAAHELARKHPALPDEGDRIANLRNRVEMRQIMDDQLTVLVPLGELRAVFAELEVRTKQRDANALTLEAYRKAQETVLADNKRLTAELTSLRAGYDALVAAACMSMRDRCADMVEREGHGLHVAIRHAPIPAAAPPTRLTPCCGPSGTRRCGMRQTERLALRQAMSAAPPSSP